MDNNSMRSQNFFSDLPQYQGYVPYLTPPIELPTQVVRSSLTDLPDKLNMTEKPIITLPKVNPDNCYFHIWKKGKLVPVEDELIRQFILAPENVPNAYVDMVMSPKTRGFGMTFPVHLPSIHDLRGLCRNMADWLEKDFQGGREKGEPMLKPEVLGLIDPVPVFPVYRNIYRLTKNLDLNMGAYTNALFVGQTESSWNSMVLHASEYVDDGTELGMLNVQLKFDESPNARKSEGMMSLLVWNCRGMARPSFSANLKHLVRQHRPCFMLLSECRTSPIQTAKILGQQCLGYTLFYSEPMGIRGGLLTVWDSNRVSFTEITGDIGEIEGRLEGTVKNEV